MQYDHIHYHHPPFQHLPVPLTALCLPFFSLNPQSPISAAQSHKGMQPPSGARATYLWPHPQRLSLHPLLSPANSQ